MLKVAAKLAKSCLTTKENAKKLKQRADFMLKNALN